MDTHFHNILVYKVTYYRPVHNIMTEKKKKNTKYQKLFVGSQEDIARQTLNVYGQEHLSTAYLATVVPLFSDSGVWKKSPEDDKIKRLNRKPS